HELALNTDGLRLGGSVLIGRSKPDLGGAPFKTDTIAADLSLSYPVLLRQDRSLLASAGFTLANQELAFGGTLLSRDKLRIGFARLDYEASDRRSLRGIRGFTMREPRWRGAAGLELSQGIDGLGASNDCVPLAD